MLIPRSLLLKIPMKALPFADAASEGLPMSQLLRLSLFQVSVGMATVMLLGTLNRVMIVELSVPAIIVALMIAIPVLVAPFRALLGFRSDNHRSAIGWKRIPYLWFGSLWQMGGLAVMPFALLVLSGQQTTGPAWAGEVLAAFAFLMTGVGLHMTQTAGLALATDRADDETRPRVVALLYTMFLLGMGLSAIVIGWLLTDFTPLTLIRVVQGAALVGILLNLVALWKQEKVRPMSREERAAPRPLFRESWADLISGGQAGRLLAVVFLGTMAFNMQDVLLEPYGGEVLGLSVSATTLLTALWAVGAMAGFLLAGRRLARGRDPFRIAASGLLVGIAAFSCVIFSAPMQVPALFFGGSFLIGLGAGLFAVATLTAAMALPATGKAGHGLALGAWGAAQATAAGLAIAFGGGIRDSVNHLAKSGALGEPLANAATGYSVVYHIEIGLLFVTLAIIGRLMRRAWPNIQTNPAETNRLNLAQFPT
ncbi:PucC family protein [Maritimibacter sp. UBA3975]|uniref:PucC family protein n=1 Tax=Maritimibacter sp. UBA3975 TaxID=1946833 RepID=UPI000C0B3D2A|nr:PucC family protein [Maritimibacter sp. UBA3975]MAM62911.1 MFS transporter [Maritimibacter sp.]|tara:strand:- start:11035 stop:12477 length:1443 start_codon:yes stop_codon:yes gene_type:complete